MQSESNPWPVHLRRRLAKSLKERKKMDLTLKLVNPGVQAAILAASAAALPVTACTIRILYFTYNIDNYS